jgi:MFS family permease
VLVICCSSLFIVGLDSTIVNVALPSIGQDLHASVAGLQWTIDGYALVLASFLMLSGATADRVGRRRVFLIGLATFTASSGLCSLAPGLGWLIAFRMLQATGGSMLNPVAMSIITNTFTDKTERARAIGVWGGGYGLSMALGPVVGGLLVDSVGWRGTFWVNIPVGLTVIALTARFVPESRAPRPRRPDPFGQALIIVMLGSLTYAIIEGPGLGWHSPVIMALFAVAVVALAVFVAYEARCAEPVLDPRFFRSAPFAGSVLTAISATAAVGGFLFLATLYLQDVRGMSALRAGLHMLPMATMMALGAVVSSRILARRGAAAHARGRRGAGRGRRAAVPADCLLGPGAAGRRVHRVRHRRRRGERADHVHGGVRHAGIPGRRGLGHRLHQPPDRPVPRHRRHRLDPGRESARQPAADRVRFGQPRRLAAAGRLRRRRLRARPGHDQPVGARHRRPHRRHIRGRRAQGARPATPAARRSSAGSLGR